MYCCPKACSTLTLNRMSHLMIRSVRLGNAQAAHAARTAPIAPVTQRVSVVRTRSRDRGSGRLSNRLILSVKFPGPRSGLSRLKAIRLRQRLVVVAVVRLPDLRSAILGLWLGIQSGPVGPVLSLPGLQTSLGRLILLREIF